MIEVANHAATCQAYQRKHGSVSFDNMIATTKVTVTITQLLYSKFEGNPSIEWGINQEAATNLYNTWRK